MNSYPTSSENQVGAATRILRHEHEAILRMLDASEKVALQLERGERVSAGILSGLLEFFRLFADRCHHGKEEEVLFPALEQKGLPRLGGPTGVMLAEHEKGRELLKEMAGAVEAYAKQNPDAPGRYAAVAREYVELLRQHIFKENNFLFAMADSLLSDSEQSEIAAAFDRIEVERMGPGTHERLHAQMDRLSAEISKGVR